ncbi:MAG TPA: lipopolysaccharide biosynthesis protein [Dissulfurispiraceae bacterium]
MKRSACNGTPAVLLDTKVLSGDIKKKSLLGGLQTIAGEGINFLLRLVSSAVLARLLVPEDFGIIGMVTAFIAIAERFKDLGLSIATVQKKEITHEQVSNLFWINVLIGTLLMIILCAFSKVAAWFYTDKRLVWITIATSTSFLWGGLTVQHQAILWRKMQFMRIAAVNIGTNILSIIIAVIFAVKGYGYWALVAKEMSRSFFLAAGTWLICPWRPGLPARNTDISNMIHLGRDVTGFNLVTFFSQNIDQILIGRNYGPGPLGIYKQAYQFMLLPISYLMFPAHNVAQPALSILQNDASRYRQYYKKVITLLSFVSMPVVIFLFLYSQDIILLLLGRKWVQASEIYKVMAVASFFVPVTGTTAVVMLTLGKTRRYFFIGLAKAIILIFAFAVGIKWGALGVAYGQLAANYIFIMPLLFFALKETPISVKLFFSSILPSIMCSLFMGIILSLFSRANPSQSSLVTIAESLPIAVAAYFAAWMAIPGGRLKLKGLYSDFAFLLRKGSNERAVSPSS